MHRKNLFICLIGLSIFFLSSCTKEMSEENGGIPPVQNFTPSVATADSNYLDKIMLRNISYGYIDSSILVFHYDAQKRLKDVLKKDGLDSAYFLLFFYNSNDTLPYKVTIPDDHHYHYFYDNMGRVVKDSVIDYATDTLYRVGAYSYGPNKIYLNITTGYPERDTFSLDARGNVTAAKLYTLINGTYVLSSTVSAVFDNNPNPYVKIPEFRNFIFSYDYYYQTFSDLYRANNLISQVYSEYAVPGGISYSDTTYYTNTYYPNGFLKNVIAPAINTVNHTFIYKAL